MYRILVNRYGAGSPLVRRFYQRSLELANQKDRGRLFSDRLRNFAAESGSAQAIESLLLRNDLRALLSEVFSGDSSLA